MATKEEIAQVVDDCTSKVGAWSTVGSGTHERRLETQRLLGSVSRYLRGRAAAIRAGNISGLYDDGQSADEKTS